MLHGGAYDYVIMRVLGQGTFGITYLAKVRMTGRLGSLDSEMLVCVKEFFMRDFNGRSELTVTTGSKEGSFSYYKERFTKEARSLSKLEHPGIVRVVDLFEGNNTAYYVMEYLDGGSLDKLISDKKGLSLAEALPLIRQIAEALDYMHSKRMLHLDLKPLNVMLDKAGKTVLIDFGLAKQFNENGEPESNTSIGQGTPGYAPIEQATYKHGDGFPTTIDIYALGATFYKMLSGHRPPNASDIFNEGFECVDFSAPAFTSQVTEVIQRAMSPKKKARYQTAKEFLAALRTINADDATIIEDVDVEDLQPIPKIEVNSKPRRPREKSAKVENKQARAISCSSDSDTSQFNDLDDHASQSTVERAKEQSGNPETYELKRDINMFDFILIVLAVILLVSAILFGLSEGGVL